MQEGSCEMTAKTADQDAAEHEHARTSHSNHVDSAKSKDPRALLAIQGLK